MKSIPNLFQKQRLSIVLMLFITALIWLVLPHFYTTNTLYLTAALYLGWALKLIIIDFSPAQVKLPLEHQKELNILKGRLTSLIRFLQKTPLIQKGRQANLAVLPWHLVIGPSQAGKTTLLANSEIPYLLSKKLSGEEIQTASSTPEWWVTRQLVLVDIPGNWPLFKPFLHLLRKKMSTKLTSIILTLPIPELMQASQTQTWDNILITTGQQITWLRNTLGQHLTFHLVLTKCDLLPGFREFFEDSSQEERLSTWGISLPALHVTEKLQDVVYKRFNALIKQLNQQVVLRLHQTRDIRKRPLIKDFPIEVEQLRDHILQYVMHCPPDLALCGIWLTSALQPSKSLRDLSNPTTHLSLQTPTLLSLPTPSKPFFIRQLLQHTLPGWSGHPPIKQKTTARRLVYAVSGSAFIAAGIVLGKDFATGLANVHQLQASIQTFEQTRSQAKSLSNTLTLLANLHIKKNSAATISGFTERLLSFYSIKTYETADRLSQETLHTLFLPLLSRSLETWLKIPETPPSQRYTVLSARLMLAGKLNFEKKTIAHALQITGLMQQEIPMLDLYYQLDALEQAHFRQSVNPALIHDTRQTLARLPVYQLGMILLKNKFEGQNEKLFTEPYFNSIINEYIPAIALEIEQGNAILGDLAPSRSRTRATIIRELRNHYQQHYAKIWINKLNKLAWNPPHDLFAIDTLVTDFANEEAPLSKQLQTIHTNTAFAPILQMNASLASIHTLFELTDKNNLNQWEQNKNALNTFHHDLEAILTASNPSRTAFQLVMQSMRDPEHNTFAKLQKIARKNPEPLKKWLIKIAQNSWLQVVTLSGAPAVNPSLISALNEARHPAKPATAVAALSSPVFNLALPEVEIKA